VRNDPDESIERQAVESIAQLPEEYAARLGRRSPHLRGSRFDVRRSKRSGEVDPTSRTILES